MKTGGDRVRIALCDDDAQENERLAKLIGIYAFARNYDLQCECFTDGRDLLRREKFDLYFLDFRMEPMDGIAVAKALKERFNQTVTICYLTNYEAAAAQIINHRIYADGFLKKPVDPELLEEKLDQFYRMSFFTRLELRQGKRYDTIYTQDLLYVEADNKQVRLHMFDRTEEYHYTLNDMAAMLGDGFFRIHRSFLVNLQHIASYDAKSVKLRNGELLPLKNRSFADAYHNYMFLMNR